ncbi:MAG: creatininase family protein, partial [Anaerolineales bacterium]|nr:creatininase family protein [Anaerolineales bacterium]
METRQLSTMNWMQVESYLRSDDRLMLILGACEQHGYLSLLTDVQIPETIAQAASERTGVLVAPSVPFGYSPFFAAYPGTISLRIAT